MTVSDAILALLLSARIHGSENALRATAKRCAQRLPRSKRFLMFSLIDSRTPLELLTLLVTDPDQWQARQRTPDNPHRRRT